jgi:hypothetical protein
VVAIADWALVVNAAVRLTHHWRCDTMPLCLSQVTAVLLGGGPDTVHKLYPDDSGNRDCCPISPTARTPAGTTTHSTDLLRVAKQP